MSSISLQNLSDESSYSHDLSKQSQSFQPRRSDTISCDHFSCRLQNWGVPVPQRRGADLTQYPEHDTTDTRIRALSYFPYFLTPSSYGLTSCLIFCDCGCTLSRRLHRAVRGDPRVFFPSGYSSFKAQQCVRGAWTAPSRAPNLAFGSGDFHLPLWSSSA